MALVLKDRVVETSTSSGTGTFTLSGAQTGYQSFSAIGNGNTTYYTIQGKNSDGTLTDEWEVGLGTYNAGTLTRDTVLSNSLGTTAKIAFSAGDKDVFVTYPSGKAILGDTSAVSSTGTGSVVLSTNPTITGGATINATSQDINIGTSQTSGDLNLGTASNRAGAINIGTNASTAPITIGSSLGTGNINVGAGNSNIQTLNIGSNGTTLLNIFADNASVSAQSMSFDTALLPVNIQTMSSGQNTVIGSTSDGASLLIDHSSTYISSPTVNISTLTASQAVFTDSGKNLVSKATTGSNDVVLSTSPTITGLTVAAGTTTVPPIKLTNGTNLTTATAGSIEYDGLAFYNSIAASTRGVMPSEQYVILNTPYTLTSQTAAQKLFNASTNGAVTLPVGTYQFECLFSLTSLSITSGSFGFAMVTGTAVVGSQAWQAYAIKPTSFAVPANSQLTFNTAANIALTGANTSTNASALIRGTIKITTAGTIIPSVSLGIASAGVVGANSYFKISPVSKTNAANITVGNWS
jgi:hypothetical protein